MKRDDLSGRLFGDWRVLEFSRKNAAGELYWLAVCKCGNVKDVKAASLRSGKSTNCGCKGRNFQHGMTKTRTFKSWDSMLQRCLNSNDPSFPRYGGRGISICKRWRESFEAFLSDMGERPEGMSLDRIDNDKGYSPRNCRWADASLQQRNTKVSKHLTVNGRTMALIEWARESGLEYSTLLRRYKAGWDHADIVGRPSRNRKKGT